MVLLEKYSGQYRTPCGAVRTNETVRFCVDAPDRRFLTLNVRSDDGTVRFEKRMEKDGDLHRCEISFDCKGLYFYSISDSDSRFLNYTEEGGAFFSAAQSWAQMLVTDDSYVPAEDYSGGIAYQIFPDRFAIKGDVIKLPGRIYHSDLSDIPQWRPDSQGKIRNNDFYGGNLRGITGKLDYLADLGVTLIYLNPIFVSNSNHRYDTGDYHMIDPQLGTEDDFRYLCAAAKEKGIRIILDGVFSHTGDDSIYFNRYGNYDSLGAYQSKESPYFSWYNFKKWPDKFDSWWGIITLPEVNEMDPSYTEFITGPSGVIDHWMSAGASGFRLDVADELPDEFIVKIRQAVRRNDPNGLLIGEVWEDASNKISYGKRRKYFQGDELDGCMNYPFKNAVLDFIRSRNAEAFRDSVEEICLHYPADMLSTCLNMLSSHDTERAINALAAPQHAHKSRDEQAAIILSKDEYLRGVEMLKLAYALMFFLPGIPMIYYGDEIGLQGYGDPFCRGFFCEDRADANLQGSIKDICKKRKANSDVLGRGNTEFFLSENGIIGFYRTSESGRLAFVINLSDETVTVLGEDIDPWRYEVIRIS
ncbi:MAG: glycoside hydrolase family 13 protein [Oscillospiraceae bacterium]|nr:glycoside hydrolase family 13 protein [Oscillospiraceae bacterium]